jgi:mannose-6-phosphate isomerase-like protein (cupin superfamily)
MAEPLPFEDIPGSDRARRFEGKDHGATVSFFITSHQPGTGPDLHRHPYEETFIVQEGTGVFTAAGVETEVTAGHVLIVPATTPHKFLSTGDGPLRQVTIHPAPEMEQEDLE